MRYHRDDVIQEGHFLRLKCDTSIGAVTVFGTRLSMSAGDMKSSHEYMMAASRAEFSADDGTMYSGLYRWRLNSQPPMRKRAPKTKRIWFRSPKREPDAPINQVALFEAYRFATISSTLAFASPSSMSVFSLKNSGFCTPE